MNNLIDYLESIDILSIEKLDKYIWESDIATLDTLITYIRQLIDEDYETSEYNPFTFIPNGDICGTGGCTEISCRQRRAQRFAVFAALYADKEYIQLEFITSEHYDFCDLDEIQEDEELYIYFKLALLKDLSIILAYKELIENGIVCITPSHKVLCPSCFQKEILGENKFDVDSIIREYLVKAKVILRAFDETMHEAQVGIKGIDEFFPGHDLFWTITDKESLDELKYEQVGEVIRNKEYSEEFVGRFIQEEILSTMYTTKYCYEQKGKLITNKLSDAMFLAKKSQNYPMSDMIKYVDMLPEYDLLITENLQLKDVIRLRQEESEAFNKYRIALNNAVIEQNKTFNITDWNKIYDDIIYPELNNLDLKMKQIKEGRLKRFFGTMAVVGTAIVANKYGNLINPDLSSSVQAFATTIGAAGVNSILDKSSLQKSELQNNDYFFLWKLKKRIKKY